MKQKVRTEQSIFTLRQYDKKKHYRELVVVKWSACSPSTLTIQVRIPLKSAIIIWKERKRGRRWTIFIVETFVDSPETKEQNVTSQVVILLSAPLPEMIRKSFHRGGGRESSESNPISRFNYCGDNKKMAKTNKLGPRWFSAIEQCHKQWGPKYYTPVYDMDMDYLRYRQVVSSLTSTCKYLFTFILHRHTLQSVMGSPIKQT